ncbi:MAG: hypothetical protein ACI8RD_000922 [Bacillariaceae sp.]|jgi:hypothetical protein
MVCITVYYKLFAAGYEDPFSIAHLHIIMWIDRRERMASYTSQENATTT